MFNVNLEQVEQVQPTTRIYEELAKALRVALNQMILKDDIDDNDTIYFTLGSTRLNHAYHGWGLTAREWRNRTYRSERSLRTCLNFLILANTLVKTIILPFLWFMFKEPFVVRTPKRKRQYFREVKRRLKEEAVFKEPHTVPVNMPSGTFLESYLIINV